MSVEHDIMGRLIQGWTLLAGDDGQPAHWYRHGSQLEDIPAEQLPVIEHVLSILGVAAPETCPECGRGPAEHLPDWQGRKMCLKERAAPASGGLGRMMSSPNTHIRSDPQG